MQYHEYAILAFIIQKTGTHQTLGYCSLQLASHNGRFVDDIVVDLRLMQILLVYVFIVLSIHSVLGLGQIATIFSLCFDVRV